MSRPRTTKKAGKKGAPSASGSARAYGSSRDATRLFHREWLGLAQPIEGLVFSVPALDEAPAPAARADITAAIRALLVETEHGLALRSVRELFERFLGYDDPAMLVPREQLPDLFFYAPESRQEIRPSFAIARGPFAPSDPYAVFETSDSLAPQSQPETSSPSPYLALVWDLSTDSSDALALDLDAPEDATGPWRYPPTAKLERLLRHAAIPIGFVSNRRHLRLVYAPPGEATSHLTFRFEDLADAAGRPLALALDLLFHARRTYRAAPGHTFEGLLAESRRRQADVTEELAQQVKDAIELLLAGFEHASSLSPPSGERAGLRGQLGSDAPDSLRAALEAGHVYDGILDAILRLVFLLYAEDRSLLPVAHPLYAAHLSVLALYERLVADAGLHPESMHQRYGAYGALVSLFRAVYFGVRHADLHLPPRQGRLFDPSAFPFLEGGLPGWTAAVSLPEDRAAVRLPAIDDGTIHEVLHRLVMLDGQRISYRDLSVEQIGAVYESLMGFEVVRMEGPAVRLGKHGHWLEVSALRRASKTELSALLDDRAGLTKAAIKNVIAALAEHASSTEDVLADALAERTRTSERDRHRARTGQLVLQPTASRRSTGSHYTPRSLSEKVVRRTLEPILACLGEAPSAADILELKVCDPAMGSGAFLVEACRFLGDALVEAWRRSGELPAIVEAHGDALLHAKRWVAQRCLYGVDKNPAAVELAKLSLWLETLSADMPFTFLDHVLRHGDSLVGLDLAQVRAFHWSPEVGKKGEQLPLVAKLVDDALAEVKESRDAIQSLAEDESDAGQREKRRLLEIASLAMEKVKLVADVCVGAFFAETKDKARKAERSKRLGVVEAYLAGDEERREELESWAEVIRKQHAPFHWHLELPEVFFLERRDPLEKGAVNRAAFMDAFVGNPPFMGKNGIAALDPVYPDWLQTVHEGAHGNADLSAHFFRRAASLLGLHGAIGLISTNTIAQGDTRATGLQHLVTRDGFTIYDATRSMMWPGDAAVSVSLVHLAKGGAAAAVTRKSLDGETTSAISSRLRATPERPDPVALKSNADCSFQGSIVLGMGFTLTPEERDALIAKDARNAERIFPYLGGEEVNTSPTQSHDRYVISFGQMTLEEAEQWPDLIAIVREKVKPERDGDKRSVRREYWWRFGELASALYEALVRLEHCLVVSRHSKHLVLARFKIGSIFSEGTNVFALDSFSAFATLQSRLHEPWARLLSSSLEDRLRYSASDCFETFPFPQPDPRTVIPELEDIGHRLYDARAAYMIETQQGLTQTYNLLKDAACTDAPILELRRLHEDMDRAVLAAYGWPDLEVPPFCPLTPADQKSLETFQDQLIDRLFVLNAERASAEQPTGAASGKKSPRRQRTTEGEDPQGSLL